MSGPLSTFTLAGGVPAPKKVGSLSPPASLPYGAPLRRAGGGPARRSLASLFRSGRGKSVLSRVQWGVGRLSLTTTARAPPSERTALRVSQSCHPSMSPPLVAGGPPLRRHLSDPQRRKSPIHHASPQAGAGWYSSKRSRRNRGTRPRTPGSVSCPGIG